MACPGFIFVVLIVAALLGLRWIRTEHLETLRGVPLFSLLSERQLAAVLGATHEVGFVGGAKIIDQGAQGAGFFVISDGTAKVLVDGAEVATLGPGSYFGEMAVIDGGPRTATIIAQTRVSTLEITPRALLRLLDREPMIARSLGQELIRRLRSASPPVDDEADARIDRAKLVELCRALRGSEKSDWGEASSARRRKLRFSSLFARGS